MSQEDSMKKTAEKRFGSALIIGETRNTKSFLTCMIWKKDTFRRVNEQIDEKERGPCPAIDK